MKIDHYFCILLVKLLLVDARRLAESSTNDLVVVSNDGSELQPPRHLATCGRRGEGCWVADPCCEHFSCALDDFKCYNNPRLEGQPCADSSCASGLLCSSVNNRCEYPAGTLHAPCTETPPCGGDTAPCNAGLACGGAHTPHRCHEDKTALVDEPCDYWQHGSDQCSDDLVCKHNVCKFPGPPSPPSWILVAHMSNEGGMFDGNTEMKADQPYGTPIDDIKAVLPGTPDFQRSFSGIERALRKIKFETGDGHISVVFDYAEFRAVVDERKGEFGPNIYAETSVDGQPPQRFHYNILSRNGTPEDPWIDISASGQHCSGDGSCLSIIWGENDFGSAGVRHTYLKSTFGGVNVFVSP